MSFFYQCVWLVDLGIINGGFIRGDHLYRVGTNITVGVVRTELPFQKCPVKVIIKGKYIREALEQALQLAPAKSGKNYNLSNVTSISS